MTEKWKAFWLGLFIIVALGLAVWLVLFLKPSVGDGKVLLTVRFSNVDKISVGTIVTFGGKQVGEVKEIRTVTNHRKAPADIFGNLYIYELTLKVDSSVKVYVYDEIIFATSGLLGEKSIAIIPKAPPPGAPPAHEVTHELLYARSTDKLEQTLNKLVNVAETFQDTLEEVSIFIETNNLAFYEALKSVTKTSHEVQTFVGGANKMDVVKKVTQVIVQADEFFTAAKQSHLIERLGDSFDSLQEAAFLFSKGEGTIARLVNSDCLYVQLTTVLCQLHRVLYDIKNYGLLYQFDRKWQRMNDLRRRCTEIPKGPYCGN
jgi:phospholipid/cholesterol/gamma-HCH transport system substrate-binding protein